ncbi:MAG: LysM domain-containing protein, partial [Nitrospiraceae bacterium]|nr:LysM domain-containing protein [Nitrospiraceae bacterium]
KGKKDVFLEKLKTVPEDERFTISRYTVRKNDTFRKIAKKTGVSEYVIMSLNPSGKILPLTAGTQIYIPPKGLFVADPDDRHSLKKTVSYKRHKAHSGKISGKGRLKKRSLSARHHARSAKHHRSARHHS